MKCVLMLPLPRSGSSMVAGVLDRLGVDMGPCHPPDRANPLGYFEDIRFLRLHRAWSRRYEPDPYRRMLGLPPLLPVLGGPEMGRYGRLIRTCERRALWSVKDPELCYYVDPFLRILRVPFVSIATIRDPAEVAASLGEVRGFSEADGLFIARDYLARQARAIARVAEAGLETLTIDYAESLTDPEETARRIADHVGQPLTAAAVEMIRPGLKRHGSARSVRDRSPA
jgi:hypothetical protein